MREMKGDKNRMKSFSKRLSLLLVVLLAVSMLAGCASEAPAAETSEPAVEPIVIGYVGALSGETAVWGQAGMNGMELTAKEINDAGGILGRPIEVIGLDGKGDPIDSVNAYKKLVSQGAIAVVGTNFSSCNIPMAAVADQMEVPAIATAASNPLVTVDENGNLHPYSFRIGFIDPFQGKVLAAFAMDELDAKNAAVIMDLNSDYSAGVTEFFVEGFEAKGGEILTIVEAQSGQNDFRAQLSKIAPLDPDVILVPWIYKDVALIANQARELGIDAIFLGADGWDSKELITMAGASLEGCYYTSQPSFANPVTKPFYDAYVEMFDGLVPETEALFGHDGLYWIKDAIERAGEVDIAKLRDELETTTGFAGLLGDLTVDPATHNPDKSVSVYQIKDMTQTFVGDFRP
jgi:branched-chain amino acid transport system substrate-binding protein